MRTKVVCSVVMGLAAIFIATSGSASALLDDAQGAAIYGGCVGRCQINSCGNDGPNCGGACDSDADCTSPDNDYEQWTNLWSCKPVNDWGEVCPRDIKTPCGPVYDCKCNEAGQCYTADSLPPKYYQNDYYDCAAYSH